MLRFLNNQIMIKGGVMSEFIQTYPCPTCGKRASGRGHLCHPFEGGVPFVCEFCNKSADNPRHVCLPMVEKIEYVCGNCGRMAPFDSLLCEPKLISED
jgi:predicted RNA-binding Zn-ribbon protein involved in translation (DUF1610 family)